MRVWSPPSSLAASVAEILSCLGKMACCTRTEPLFYRAVHHSAKSVESWPMGQKPVKLVVFQTQELQLPGCLAISVTWASSPSWALAHKFHLASTF